MKTPDRADLAWRIARQRRSQAPVPGRMLGFLLLMALLLLMPGLGVADEARAILNQTQVYEGDLVLLTIERAGRSLGQEPDLTPLDADFEVGGVNTSQQTQFINGRRSDKTSWQVALRPKQPGRLTIPPISVGSATTEPLTLVVEAVPEGGLGTPGDEVWLEVELGAGGDGATDAAPDKLIVQQQVPLVVRAYSARPLLDYAIEMPTIEGAVLTRIGRDQGSLTTRAGQQYRVIERRYTLNPERSGTLRIPPIVFEAELKTANAGRRPGSLAMPGLPDLFDDPMLERMLGDMRFGAAGSMFERGEPARAQSEALTLEVAPSAAGFSGEHWLPATALEVDDSWSPADGGQTPQLAVGEPATRILTLTARGLAGNQIPEIEIPVPPGFRVYPGQTESETRSDGETLIGISRQQLTLIPTTGGEVELPPIEVSWWDTAANQERTARVPALALSIAGPVAAAAPEVAADAALGDGKGDARTDPAAGGGVSAGEGAIDPGAIVGNAAAGPEREQGQGVLAWLLSRGGLLLLALLLVLATAVRFLWPRLRGASLSRLQLQTQLRQELETSLQARQARDALRSACERDDPRAAASALLAWAGAIWPDDPPCGLSALAERAARGGDQILTLERQLYGSGSGQGGWRGDALWAALKPGLGAARAPRRGSIDPVAPLYPKHAN
ncbi:BatD family protein [Halochromatium sp.]